MSLRHKIIITILSASGLVSAQQYIAQDGHLLDANNRIGSMGWNSSGSIDALNNRNNSIMTGNARGGMRFQGAMPYSSTMEFQGNTSGTLTSFRRDSVGIGQLSSGSVSGSLYIDPLRSVTSSYDGNIINTQSINRISTMLNPQQQYSVNSNFLTNQLLNPNNKAAGVLTVDSKPLSSPQFYLSNAQSATLDFSLSYRQDSQIKNLADISTVDSVSNRSRLVSYSSQLQYNSLAGKELKSDNIDEQLYLEQNLPDRIFDTAMSGSMVMSETAAYQEMASKYQSYFEQATLEMQNGNYYKAIDKLRHAEIYSELNNARLLTYFALAHFGAGEYISSSVKLYQAYDTSFDEVMSPIAIDELIKTKEAVSQGKEDLDRLYQLTGNSSLLLLKGYLEYQSGNLKDAQAAFSLLAESAPDNPIFKKILTSVQAAINK